MIIKFKKLHWKAVTPSRGRTGDAGWDLTATSREYNRGGYRYGTGIAVEIPDGYFGAVFPRSSIYTKGVILANSVGVIDSGYRGEIALNFQCLNELPIYALGDRIAQLVILPLPKVEFQEVNELGESERGTSGFGSTGQ